MLAVLGGLGAAVAWAISTLCSSRSSRMMEPMAVVALIMVVGLVITAPIAAVHGVPSFDAESVTWLVISGAGNVGGLVLAYKALRIGQVALVAPLVSTEGAIAAHDRAARRREPRARGRRGAGARRGRRLPVVGA